MNIRCNCCGRKIPKEDFKEKTSNGKYICMYCLYLQPYETKNIQIMHTSKKHNKSYGFEFECYPYNSTATANLLQRKYGFIPTYDSSLSDGGIEFKSPIYLSKNGFRKIFDFVLLNANTTNEDCGQHINIGDCRLDCIIMKLIHFYSDMIFHPLSEYMYAHKDSTEKICGRYFNDYCDHRIINSKKRFYFINTCHSNRLEFRLAKLITSEQYFKLVCMYTEMTDVLINYIISYYNDIIKNEIDKIKKLSFILVSIFKKYEKQLDK